MAYPLINVKFIILTSASFIAIFSSIAIYFCLPILISHMIRSQITLSPTSGSFENWRLNSVIDRIYLYNITNLSDLPSESSPSPSSALAAGEPAKSRPRPLPRLQQIGPITFRQDREKLNIRFDRANETVIYDQKRTWTFVPELSVLKSPDELRSAIINHVSVPLAGTTMTPEYGEIIDSIVTEQGLRLFLNHSVDALLFEGYWDLLMEQGKASGQIDVDRFGWMHNQNNTIQRAIRVFTGPSNATLDKFGAIDEFAYKRELNVWHENNTEPSSQLAASAVKCNQFRLSSAGEFFPPPEYSIIGHNNYYQYIQHQQRQQLDRQEEPPQSVEAGATDLKLAASGQSTPSQSDTATATTTITTTSNAAIGPSDDGAAGPRLWLDASKTGKSVALFMPELCRTIKLSYRGSYEFRDLLLVDRYAAGEQTFMYQANNNGHDAAPNGSQIEANSCYCIYNETSRQTSCPPNGMMDLYQCRKGSPVGISFPHFLYSTQDKSLEPYLRLFTDDVAANENEHQFFIDLETSLNVPVNVQIVLQFNVRLRNDRAMNWTEEYAYLMEEDAAGSQGGEPKRAALRDFYLPQMWIKSTASVDDTNLAHLRFIQRHLDLVTPVTTIFIFAFASILLLASAKLAYDLTYGPKSTRKSSSCDRESCSSLNGAHSCSYLDEKKKYLGMHSMAQEKSFKFASSLGNLAQGPSSTQFGKFNNQLTSLEDLHRPTTSRKASSVVITGAGPSSSAAGSVSANGGHDCESEPLNR